MIGQGFVTDKLQRLGFGFDRPLASNDMLEGRAKNRRVVVIAACEKAACDVSLAAYV